MNIKIKDIVCGVKESDGSITEITNTSGGELDFDIDQVAIVIVNMNAERDYDTIEFVCEFDSLNSVDVQPLVLTDKITQEEFDAISRIDKEKNELWFQVTEKVPGSIDMAGEYRILQIKLIRLHGAIHIYLTLKE